VATTINCRPGVNNNIACVQTILSARVGVREKPTIYYLVKYILNGGKTVSGGVGTVYFYVFIRPTRNKYTI